MGNLKSLVRSLTPTPVWTTLRRWRGNRHIRRYPGRVVERVHGGVPIKIAIRDGMSEAWYDHDAPALKEIEFFAASRLKPGAVVFDCGAHQGVVALLIAERVGPTGRVIAVEALQRNAQIARENAALNPSIGGRLIVVQAAVTEKPGDVTFTEDFSQNGQMSIESNARSGRQTVPGMTIDALREQFGQPDVIFLDIEGAEHAALNGATQLLADPRKPDWFVEVHVAHGLEAMGGSAEAICRLFKQHGYDLFHADAENDEAFTPLIDAAPKERFFLIARPSLSQT